MTYEDYMKLVKKSDKRVRELELKQRKKIDVRKIITIK